MAMRWCCKICRFSSPNQRVLITHYKLKHCHQASHCPLPCIYKDCVCTFRSELSLKKHLTRDHSQCVEAFKLLKAKSNVNCDLCNFSEVCSVSQYFAHLKTHIQKKESVRCPFQDCGFQTGVSSTFRAHKSRSHRHSTLEDLRTDLYQTCNPGYSNPENADSEADSFSLDCSTVNSDIDVQDLQDLIKHKVASLLIRMQTTLHVSKATTQEIVNELCSVYSVVQEFTPRIIESVLVKHKCVLTNELTAALAEIVEKTNPLTSLSKSGPFATEYKRSTYYKDKFKVIEPVEYFLESCSPDKFVYISILEVLTELLNRDDIVDKILQENANHSGQIKTYRDGLYCKDNLLLSSESLSIALGMYIDDYENIKKVRLDPVPDSVDGLKFELKSRLQLKGPFDLQYEDEDFKDFCNLTCS
ncbi:uncharacterized protein LOC130417430 [Triplophysa dalaica]|uniref:uncharacterized protein LOC130417430 n=1 Tax=Triplophysa dalaica TaxID=1582913 RepID=UPI0024E0072E|nr:uncharacterized protein LOC130417430 [Triplophysa dalaica]